MVGGSAGIDTVDGVHYNVIMQKQGRLLTPDLYFYGKLINGSTYEAVGDSKLFVSILDLCYVTEL